MCGMDDLVAFLRARFAELERTAQAAMHSPVSRWHAGGEGALVETDTGGHGYFATGPWGTGIDDDQAAHILAWQPAAVLALVDVGRRILEDIARYADPEHPAGEAAETDGLAWRTLLNLASLFARHPDYRPSWAPAAG